MVIGHLHFLIQIPGYIDNEKNRKTRNRLTTYENSLSDDGIVSNKYEKIYFLIRMLGELIDI